MRGCTAAHLDQLTRELAARPWEAAEMWLAQLIRAQDEIEAGQVAATGMRPSLEEAARWARLTPAQLRRAIDFNTRRLRRVELQLATLVLAGPAGDSWHTEGWGHGRGDRPPARLGRQDAQAELPIQRTASS